MLKLILGPPGTGKTTRLLRVVEYALTSGTNPSKIGYFAFTKKAANEARERAAAKFKRPLDQFEFFRTLHSFAFQRLGLSSGTTLGGRKVKEFAEIMGLELSNKGYDELTGAYLGITEDDKLLGLDQYCRATNRDPYEVWSERGETSWRQFERVVEGLKKFKRVKGLHDFTGMLTELTAQPRLIPEFDIFIVDEAQDLSATQWSLVDAIAKKAKQTYLAGDDDQAIFKWAGADVKQFLSKDAEIEVLDHSYRLPKAVFRVAQLITERITNRYEKQWTPRDEEGTVQIETSIENIEMSSGTWLVLARNKFLLNDLEESIRDKGHYYETQQHRSVDKDLIRAISIWEKHKSDEDFLPGTPNFEVCSPYVNNITTEKKIWYEAFNISETEKIYIRSLLASGENLLHKPRIQLSTIHGAKGGEADNVVICGDASKAVDENNASEDEARVAYVAVTRARKNLFLLEAKTRFTLLDNFDTMFK